MAGQAKKSRWRRHDYGGGLVHVDAEVASSAWISRTAVVCAGANVEPDAYVCEGTVIESGWFITIDEMVGLPTWN